MNVIPFEEKYREDFIEFNKNWIIEHFGFLEKEDYDTFNQIDTEIHSGAAIYFAIDQNKRALACCMVRPIDNNTWELCKFASNPILSHKGAGSAVFEASMKYAIQHNAKELFLLSNSKLKPALHIYKKYGFEEVKLDNYEYERGNIAFHKIVA